jgi:hypothetical protein
MPQCTPTQHNNIKEIIYIDIYIYTYIFLLCMCNFTMSLLKDRYFILKNMSLNVKITSKSAKSPDPLMLKMSGRL